MMSLNAIHEQIVRNQGSRKAPYAPIKNSAEPAYRAGERVVQNTFGYGTITEVSSYLDDLRITVRFDSGFSKKLVARFAKLVRE